MSRTVHLSFGEHVLVRQLVRSSVWTKWIVVARAERFISSLGHVTEHASGCKRAQFIEHLTQTVLSVFCVVRRLTRISGALPHKESCFSSATFLVLRLTRTALRGSHCAGCKPLNISTKPLRLCKELCRPSAEFPRPKLSPLRKPPSRSWTPWPPKPGSSRSLWGGPCR